MEDRSGDAPTPTEGATRRLSSWKEIAGHLKVSVRTAQRWEKTERLPARRHRHAASSSVFAFASELDAWWNSRSAVRERPKEPPAAAQSIAVLPFANLNRDEENEILCDGLTEELINALTQVKGLHVAARTSVFQFKGKTGDVRTVGARLGVRTILEGSVRRVGGRLRITAQLINAADGFHLCSERIDRRFRDLLELQEEIARTIVDALQVKLVGDRVTRQYTRDPEAYALYLEGRYHCNKRTREGFLKAIACFERVLAEDPQMALAWAGLADCHLWVGALDEMPHEETVRKGKAAALKALELDDTLAEGHASLGLIAGGYEYDWAGAESHFRRALQLNPDHAASHVLYAALVLGPQARHPEAEIHLSRACELDPLSPVTISAWGTHCLMLRDYDRAISAFRRALDLDPAHPWAHRWLGEAHLLLGNCEEAAEAMAEIASPVFAAGLLGYCHARRGRVREARQLLRDLKRGRSGRLACQIAILHLGLGDQDAALSWLERAREARSLGVQWVKVEPIWDPLRRDPRFTTLLKNMGLSA